MQGKKGKILSVFFAILLLTSVVSVIQIKPAFSSHGNQTQLTFTINPSKDSFLTQGSQSNNEGANVILRIISSDKNKPILAFDQNEVNEKLVNGRTLQSATLKLYVTDNGNNWGPDGRLLAAHRVLTDWQEGNGWNVDNSISGSGAGVTWACPVDSNISNNQNDCSVQWDGGSFSGTSTDTELVTNNIVNQWIEFDVTSDIQSFIDGTSNNGWLIKKGSESLNGSVEFASKESTSNIPQLVLVVNLSQGEILFNQYTDLVSELGSISQISDESVVADYLVDSITKLKTDTQNLVTDVNARQDLVSILDSALQSANDAGNNVLALDEAGANLKIGETKSFVDSYASQVALHSGTTISQPDADFLISKANQISTNSLKRDIEATNLISGTPLLTTSQIINLAKSNVSELRTIGNQLVSLGFTVNVDAQTMSPTRGLVLFSNSETSQEFEIDITSLSLAAADTVIIFEDAVAQGLQTTNEEFAAILTSMPIIIGTIQETVPVLKKESFFLFSLCRLNPAALGACTGFAIGIGIGLYLQLEHPEIVQQIRETTAAAPEILKDTIDRLVLRRAQITVIKEVVNNFGGNATASDFKIHVDGINPVPSEFNGAEDGVTVTLDEGAYSIQEIELPSGYVKIDTLEDDECSGMISAGQTKTCTITNNDVPRHDTITINPIADSWTHSSEPTLNFNGQDLVVKFHTSSFAGKDNRKGWLEFNLPVEPSQVSHATLRLYLLSTEFSGSSVQVFRHDNNNWLENTITFNNEPAHFAGLSAGPFAEQTFSSVNQYYEFDVTSAITSSTTGKTITLVLVGNSLNNGVSFADRETLATPPELVLEVEQGSILPTLFDENFDSELIGWTCSGCVIGQETTGPEGESPPSLPNWGFVGRFVSNARSCPATGAVSEKTFSVSTEGDYKVSGVVGAGRCDICTMIGRVFVDGVFMFEGRGTTINTGAIRHPEFKENTISLAPGDHTLNLAMFSNIACNGFFRGVFDDVKVEGPISTVSLLSSTSVGGPYFNLELNQTSVNATKPSSITIPLKINWLDGYVAEPVNVDIIGVNATGISHSVTSTYNSTSYQLFDIIFDIPSNAQTEEYLFLISVKEVESDETVGTGISLNVE